MNFFEFLRIGSLCESFDDDVITRFIKDLLGMK